MPRWEMPVPHGADCHCSVCEGGRVQNVERLTSTDRLAWLENKVISLAREIEEIKKGNNAMGYALWCQKGAHSFDENDADAERMTVDKRDPETGKKTGEEMTVHVCGKHAKALFQPAKKSLLEIEREIAEAEEIGD